MRFTAEVSKTRNEHVVLLHIMGDKDIDGDAIEHVLEIESVDAFKKAKLLAKQINRE